MELTVTLTDEQMHFLKLFAQDQQEGSENNKGTTKPLHIVRTEYKEQCLAEEADEAIYYLISDHLECHSLEELVMAYHNEAPPIAFMSFEEAYTALSVKNSCDEDTVIHNEANYLDLYEIDPDSYEKWFQRSRYHDVAYFFILQEARQYIDYQEHNLRNPHIYTASAGYSNKGEYEHFYDLLMAMGNQLLGGENDEISGC